MNPRVTSGDPVEVNEGHADIRSPLPRLGVRTENHRYLLTPSCPLLDTELRDISQHLHFTNEESEASAGRHMARKLRLM